MTGLIKKSSSENRAIAATTTEKSKPFRKLKVSAKAESGATKTA